MNFFEQLEKLKEEMEVNPSEWEQDTYQKNDVISTLEDINPEISKNSKAFKESNKYIFKQPLSYESAEKIISCLSDFKDIEDININSFKNKLHKICSLIVSKGESPVEMLVYATTAIKDKEILVNAVLDELKELRIFDGNLPEAYRNILRNWNWEEQLRLVVKSIVAMELEGFEEELIQLFESNLQLREQAAYAIIGFRYEKYYNRVINLLLSLKVDSKETSGLILNIFKRMARSSSYGVEGIFKAYMETSPNPELNNVFTSAIRQNVTSEILDKLESYGASGDRRYQRKAIILLGKINSEKSREILNILKDKDNVDKEILLIAQGYSRDRGNEQAFKNIIEDEGKSVSERTSALISLANLDDKSLIPYIEVLLNKSNEFEIAAASALVQLGKMEKITNIFKYILTNNIPDEYVRLASRQINRLRGLKISEVNSSLNKAAKSLLSGDKEFVVLSVVNLFTRGFADNDVADILLYKLNNTEIEQAKILILEYLAKNYTILSEEIGNKIRMSIVDCSQNSSSIKVRDTAMRCLEIITRKEDFRPTV